MTRFRFAAGALALATLALAAAPADARGRGGSQDGDSYLNDTMRNPRLIEPYADQRRYREYYMSQGWYDRQRAAGYRGDVRVRMFPE